MATTNRNTYQSKGNPKKRKLTKKQRRKRKVIMLVVEVLVILILLVVLAVFIKLNKINNAGELDPDKLEINIDDKTKEMLKGYTNIAIFGLDNRSNGSYESGNSDCIMIASINNDTKEVKLVSVYRDSYLNVTDTDKYTKLNAAYAKGGAEGAVKALNKNFDLDIVDYVAVDFNAIARTVDALGGIELEFTSEEANDIYTHAYVDEMNDMFGTNSSYPVAGIQLCDGVQATAYARLRNTAGDDFKRTERQRLVVSKIVEKTKQSDLGTINDIIDEVFPLITTSLKSTEILGLASSVLDYELVDTQGFPFLLNPAYVNGAAMVVPTTLEDNVILLHEYLFGVKNYEPSGTVKEISSHVQSDSGLGSGDTTRDTNPLKVEEPDDQQTDPLPAQ